MPIIAAGKIVQRPIGSLIRYVNSARNHSEKQGRAIRRLH
jgi:hypothetical protein